MSFILDALKKSENERQRQAGPGFAVVPESSGTRPRRIWPVVVVALLAINLVVVGIILLRNKDTAPEQLPVPPAAGSSAQAGAGAGPASRQIPAVPPGTAAPAVETPKEVKENESVSTESAAQPETGMPPGPARDRVIRPLAEEAGSAAPAPPASPSPSPSSPPAATTARPAPATPPVTASRPESRDSAVGALPTANDLRLEGFLTGIPLHLDLHVYYPDSRRRVVFISGSKYREGDTIKGGPVIREIVPEGVILEERGRRYLLTPD